MAEMNQEQRKKKAEFISVTAEEVRLIREQLQKDFAQSKEGKEAAFLRAVLAKYLREDQFDAFVGYFVPKRENGKVADVKTQGLEYVKNSEDVKPDAALIKRLDAFASEVAKSNLPGLDGWKYYLALLEEVKNLDLAPDVHEFIAKFNSLLVKAIKYPETDVARTIKERSLKKIPKTIALENFELYISAMKLLLYRLAMPHEAAAAANIIGSTDFHGLDEKMAKRMNIGVEEFRKGIGGCFGAERESEQRVNIIQFAQSIFKDKNKNIFVRFFTDIGQRNFAAFLVKEFEGGRSDPKTPGRIADEIRKIDHPKAKEVVENAAKSELESMIVKMIEKDRAGLMKVRSELAKTLSDKAEDLEKKHAKMLAEVRKMDEDMKSRVEKLAVVAAGAGEVAKSLSVLEAQDAANFRRATEILPVLFAKNILELVKLGKLDEATLNTEIARMRSTSTSEYVARTLSMVEDVARRVLHGEIPGDAFNKAKAQLDALAKQLLPQLTHISEAQRRIDDEMVEQATFYEEGQRFADDMIDEGDKDASSRVRWLRKHGIQPDKYQVPPEDMEYFERTT